MKSTSPDDAESAKSEERSAGFVVYRDRGAAREYLILRHRQGAHWAFPKGRIEPGESPIAAARREVAEETGIEMLTPHPKFRRTVSYRFRRHGAPVHKTVIYHLARAGDRRVRLSDEHSAAAWLPHREVRARLTYPESRKLVDEAEAHLRRAEGQRVAAGRGVV